MTINEMKQYNKNMELTAEAYNDVKKRALKAGYVLFREVEHFHNKCEKGGYWLHRTQIWTNGENCVTIQWAVWNWGSNHPEMYPFDGHIMTNAELYGRA